VINSGYLIMITGTIYTLVSIDQFMRANKAISHPTTIEEVMRRMESLPKFKHYR
jgi:hypothetical protein